MLDSDICIYGMSGRYPALDRRLRQAGNAVCLSSVVLAELSFGAENSQRPAANRTKLDAFIAGLRVVDFDADAARDFGRVRFALQATGTIIGPYDLLIGAHARSIGATLVTNNRREFDRIPGLAVENWAA